MKHNIPRFELNFFICILKNNLLLIMISAFLGMMISIIYVATTPPRFVVSGAILVDNSDTNSNYNNSSEQIVDNKGPIFTNNAPTSERIMISMTMSSILDKVIDNLNLDIQIKPKLFPVVGHYMYYHALKNDQHILNKPLLCLDCGYSWGGESVVIPVLNVPESMLTRYYTLKVINSNHFVVFAGENVVVSGPIGVDLYNDDKSFHIKITSIRANSETLFYIRKMDKSSIEKDLIKKIQINEVVKSKKDINNTTGIINVSITGVDKYQITAVLSNLLEIIDDETYQHRIRSLDDALRLVQKQILAIQQKLYLAQKEIAHIKSSNDIVSFEDNVKALSLAKSSLEDDLMRNELTLNGASNIYGEKNPVILGLLERKNELLKQQKIIANKSKNFTKVSIEFNKLQSNVEVYQKFLDSLMIKEKELELLISATNHLIKIVDMPRLPLFPENFNGSLIIMIGLILGFIFGVFICLLKWLLRLNYDPFFLNKLLGIPTIAIIKFCKEHKKYLSGNVSLVDPLTIIRQQINNDNIFRSDMNAAVTEVLFSIKSCRVISCFSISSRCKSDFISINLANELSCQKLRVLLIKVVIDSNISANDYLNVHDYFNVYMINHIGSINAILSEINMVLNDSKYIYDLFLIDVGSLSDKYDLSLLLQIESFKILIMSQAEKVSDSIKITNKLCDHGLIPNAVIYQYTHKQYIHDIYSK